MKNILQFDDVMNDQRKVVFEQRKDLMDDTEASKLHRYGYEYVEDLVKDYIPETHIPSNGIHKHFEIKLKQIF